MIVRLQSAHFNLAGPSFHSKIDQNHWISHPLESNSSCGKCGRIVDSLCNETCNVGTIADREDGKSRVCVKVQENRWE